MSESVEGFVRRYTDLMDRDAIHISGLIIENFPFDEINTRNAPWLMVELIVAAAYLYSKCPGNSDNPVSFKFAKGALKKDFPQLSLMNGIRGVKELGFIPQYCVVTSTVVLRNMKRENKNDYFIPIYEKAIEISESKEVKVLRQGRSPTVVASACFYCAGQILQKPVTMGKLAREFGVTEVSIRNFWVKIKPKNHKIILTTKSNAPRVQCKDCTYLGEKLPKRQVRDVWGWGTWKKKWVSPGWECTGSGSVHGHVPSVTYKRICPAFKQKEVG